MQSLSRKFLDGPDGEAAVDMIQDILERSNRREVYQRACWAMIDMDLRPYAKQIKAPTLVIGAQHDSMDPKHMEWMAGAFSNGQYHHCPDGSHFAMYDDQAIYFDGLLKFIRDVDDRHW